MGPTCQWSTLRVRVECTQYGQATGAERAVRIAGTRHAWRVGPWLGVGVGVGRGMGWLGLGLWLGVGLGLGER